MLPTQEKLAVVDALLQDQRLCENCGQPGKGSLYVVQRYPGPGVEGDDIEYWCLPCRNGESFRRIYCNGYSLHHE